MGYGKKAVHIAIQLTGQKRFGSANCQVILYPFNKAILTQIRVQKTPFLHGFYSLFLGSK